jgi:hypothetical protein
MPNYDAYPPVQDVLNESQGNPAAAQQSLQQAGLNPAEMHPMMTSLRTIATVAAQAIQQGDPRGPGIRDGVVTIINAITSPAGKAAPVPQPGAMPAVTAPAMPAPAPVAARAPNPGPAAAQAAPRVPAPMVPVSPPAPQNAATVASSTNVPLASRRPVGQSGLQRPYGQSKNSRPVSKQPVLI